MGVRIDGARLADGPFFKRNLSSWPLAEIGGLSSLISDMRSITEPG